MRRRSLWRAFLAALGVATISASSVLAAQLGQEATPTPTETSTPFGPTPTPTETLLPPPQGGGRVAVEVLVVRVGPDQSWPALGGLQYGQVVYPVARSVNGNWVAIEWDGDVGWILASLVQWHPGFDVLSLPIFLPPFTATPLNTPVEAVSTSIPSTAIPPTASFTPPASSTPPSTLAMASASPSPTQASATAAAVLLPATPQADAAGPLIPPSSPLVLTAWASQMLPWLGATIPIALLGLYGWRFLAGERELKRYSKGYSVVICPACQVGHLHLEESVRRTLGIARVARSVRCDACHSMLRQLRPGLWRYMIDPHVNPALARSFNSHQLNDVQVSDLASHMADYPPILSELQVESAPILTDEEILAELEARIAAEAPLLAEGSEQEGDSLPPPSPSVDEV